MATKLSTNNLKIQLIDQIIESVSEPANNSYYVFMGRHAAEANVSNIPDLYERPKDINQETYRNMIQGKRCNISDLAPCIRFIPYEANTVYAMYDDTDTSLSTKEFFVIVDEGSWFHVYKCLDNNMGSPSTIEPSFAHITGANTELYQTSDGYRWKYMFTTPVSVKEKFSSSAYFPIVANTSVETSAVDGAIDIIKIDGAGKGYDNYLTGMFSSAHLRVAGDPTVYEIANTIMSQVNGFYTDCLLYLSSGTGSGQYANIINFFANNSGNFIVIDQAFEVPPVNGTSYQIYPKVNIYGDGSQTVNAIARALINTYASNAVYRIEILERGAEYDYATANISANAVVGVESEADIRIIFSPPGGHGKNPKEELYCNVICFSSSFSNTESNTILAVNRYQQIGLLQDPIFANVVLEINSLYGSFINDDQVFKINPVLCSINATSVSGNSRISSNTAEFTLSTKAGDYIYLQSSNGYNHQLIRINDVINTTHINATSNINFSCNDVKIYHANVSTHFYVSLVPNSTHIVCSNVVGVIQANDSIVGFNSGGKAVVNTVSRNDVTKGFDTFIQLYKYTGSVISGTFIPNETVFQGNTLANSTANAILHSVIIDSGATIYTSNQSGSFEISNSIFGNTSGAAATLTAKYYPELVFGSGKILFLENIDAIERSNTSNETLRFYLKL